MSQRLISLALIVIAWFLLVGQGSCRSNSAIESTPPGSTKLRLSFDLETGDDLAFTVDVVESPEDRARGLMFRKELKEDHGMLFIFERLAIHRFYMKNTFIPLDIVFLDRVGPKARVVGVLHDMVPHDETSRFIQAKSLGALEIRAGLAKKHGITTGTEVRLISP
jgi:uncharacterized protein